MMRSSNAFGMLMLIFPFPFTAYQSHCESEESIFMPRSEIRLNSPLARDMLNARRTERLTRGDGRVEYVRVEPVFGGKRGFGGCVEEEVVGAAEDEASMSTRKGGSM